MHFLRQCKTVRFQISFRRRSTMIDHHDRPPIDQKRHLWHNRAIHSHCYTITIHIPHTNHITRADTHETGLFRHPINLVRQECESSALLHGLFHQLQSPTELGVNGILLSCHENQAIGHYCKYGFVPFVYKQTLTCYSQFGVRRELPRAAMNNKPRSSKSSTRTPFAPCLPLFTFI